jgi:excisionase family DNA binding protein
MVSNSNKGQAGLENWRFLSTQEVAKILGVRVETVRNYIKRGKLPAVKLGRDYKIAQRDLEEFLTPEARRGGVSYSLRDTGRAREIKEVREAVSLATMPGEKLPAAREGLDVGGIAQWLVEEGEVSELEAGRRAEELLAEIREITHQLQTEKPPYPPGETAQARREMDEIRAMLSANPPYPTIKEFMESGRGRGAYDPD